MTNQSVKLDPSADAKSIVTTPKGVYTWSLLGADGRPYAPSLVLTPGPGWVLDKDGQITVRGERGLLTDQYDVTASSTLDRDPYGVPCSPDNLKKSSGYWAESVSGDGQGETLEIRLRKPGRLLGIMLETGISPVTDPEKDSEARRHPNIAYSMFSRPKGIQVTLNGTYTFDATLRDDWTPQVGRLDNPSKGVDRLLRIWEKVEKTYPDWHLDIVGDGPDADMLKDSAQKLGLSRIAFHGFQNPEPYYSRASVFCMTSTFEGFGLVLVEAMQHGCVPVAFDSYPAVRDIISHGENGILVPPFQEEIYSNALTSLINNPGELEKFSRHSLVTSRNFSSSNLAARWAAIL